MKITADTIVVIDFGSQYNQLITRRIREMNVYSALYPYDVKIEELEKIPNLKGIILSGGPSSVYEGGYQCDRKIFDLPIPILGICYGMQILGDIYNGKIEKAKTKEYGKTEIKILEECPLFSDTPSKQIVWMSHGDSITQLPVGFREIAKSKDAISSIANDEAMRYGVQFHPEVRNTEYGNTILSNFVFKIAKAKPNWTMDYFIESKVEEIKATVKDENVLLGISGGVDSSVAAVLIHKAIKNQLTCMFVDHGLLREGEGDKVMEELKQNFAINIIRINAQEEFLNALKGVTSPEEKRHIIGHKFIEVFERESSKIRNYTFLGQGTLYTDIIESGTKTAQTIKSHHNVGGLPKNMRLKLLEPLSTLFKDEVRKLGEQLGIDHSLVYRQPFPGPGLAIRIIGDVTEEKLQIVRHADTILQEEIKKAGLNEQIWQYFAVLPGVKTVGVMGDQRTYSEMIGIRAVASIDGMTSDWAKIPYDVLEKISNRIVNEIESCNRVVYDITSKPPGTIEWE